MSGRTKVLLVCAVSLGASILRLSAQEVGGDTITGKVHQIEKVTVTARRSPNKVTSAVPIQTMSRQDISQLGIQNMADAVRRFAGANVKDYGGIGGLKTVSIRNMGAAHTAVSYDGVAVSNCQAGQIDIGRFSLDNVSSACSEHSGSVRSNAVRRLHCIKHMGQQTVLFSADYSVKACCCWRLLHLLHWSLTGTWRIWN